MHGMSLEVVFSGRGFLDGRGLSSMTGNSMLASVVDRGEPTSDDTLERAKAERRQVRRASKRYDVEPSTPVAYCRCGCGMVVLPREVGGGRPRRYVDRVHQSRHWQRHYRRPLAPNRPAPPLAAGRVFGRQTAAA